MEYLKEKEKLDEEHDKINKETAAKYDPYEKKLNKTAQI